MAQYREPDRSADLGMVQEMAEENLRPARIRVNVGTPWGRPEVMAQLFAGKHVIAEQVEARFFAVLVDGEVVSYADLYQDGPDAQIEDIGTLPEHRGHGYARSNFGPVGGDGAWIDYSQGGGGPIPHAGGPFSLVLTHSFPNARRGPYLGLADPCNAAPPPVYQYNLTINFPGCLDRCQGVTCNDGNPCTTDSCNPADGSCVYTQSVATSCGSGNVGRCLEGRCLMEIAMNTGTSGDQACAGQGMNCVEPLPVGTPPQEICLLFHPTASVTSSSNGTQQAIWCGGTAVGLACETKVNVCHHCPLCRIDGIFCSTSSSSIVDSIFVECTP
jgi:hypothetical protein